MFKRMMLLAVITASTGTANAGLFDSNDFKCGREDAVKALSDYIKNDAAGLLQSDFITKEHFNYDKPVSVYQQMLNGMAVNVTNVSTSGKGNYGLNCSATISVKIPQNTLDIVKKFPDYLSDITRDGGRINNDNVTWDVVKYSARLADNNKDIIFSEFNRSYISRAIYEMSVLSVNKEQIVHTYLQKELMKAQSAYAGADRELNAIWKALPDSVRNSMKKEQLAWVNSKTSKCGKLSDATSETTNIQHRVDIYQCQTRMTDERISWLTGESD
ncbi:TPA: lysozyme inhibitor LprI family protein [Escherichia coli]|uniref:lysozyme inhibitor LprI family protein n=1 Tax=Escherichia coli TaxID=562 RepID=UPI00398863E8